MQESVTYDYSLLDRKALYPKTKKASQILIYDGNSLILIKGTWGEAMERGHFFSWELYPCQTCRHWCWIPNTFWTLHSLNMFPLTYYIFFNLELLSRTSLTISYISYTSLWSSHVIILLDVWILDAWGCLYMFALMCFLLLILYILVSYCRVLLLYFLRNYRVSVPRLVYVSMLPRRELISIKRFQIQEMPPILSKKLSVYLEGLGPHLIFNI